MTGNKVITLLFNLLNNTTFTDIYCCYCMFKKELINHEKLKEYQQKFLERVELYYSLINK